MPNDLVSNKYPGNDQSEPISCGTTLIAIEFNGGVIMGVDSRTSAGSFIANRVTDKITPVIDDRLYVLRAGSAADTQAITDIVRYHIDFLEVSEGAPLSVFRMAQLYRKYCYQYRDQLSASIIVVGHDDTLGMQIYAIPIGGFVTRQRCISAGSGGTFVAAYLKSQWKEGMDRHECELLVKNAVRLATIHDMGSGGVMRLGILSNDRPFERKLFRPDRDDFPKFDSPSYYPTFLVRP